MDEKTMNRFYELFLDMLQDSRADSKIEERYDILMDTIFNNLRLNYDGKTLKIDSEEGFANILKTLEPRRYNDALEKLKNKEEENNGELLNM